MKTIKIFLAASCELEEHREAFTRMTLKLNQIYRPKGIYIDIEIWEFMSSAMNEAEKQAEYDQKVRESDIFIALFYTTAGMYTQRELGVAYECYCKNNRPDIQIYMRKPEEGVEIDDKLAKFTKIIDQKYSSFKDTYSHFDMLKYKFITTFQTLGDDLKLDIITQNGKLYVEGVAFADLENAIEK